MEVGGRVETILLHYWERPEYWEETGRLEEICCHSVEDHQLKLTWETLKESIIIMIIISLELVRKFRKDYKLVIFVVFINVSFLFFFFFIIIFFNWHCHGFKLIKVIRNKNKDNFWDKKMIIQSVPEEQILLSLLKEYSLSSRLRCPSQS